MKYLIYILIIINFNSCKAQKETEMKDELIIPQINKNHEIFDIEVFNKETDSVSGKRIVINETFYLEEESQSYGYISRKHFNDSYFMVSKKYHKNRSIKQKGVSFNNGYPIGLIYEFNEEGKFIKEINTDEGYDFGWEKILDYCHKNNIKLTKGYPKSGGVHTEIYKTEVDEKKVWQITYYDYKEEQLFEVVLDGKKGKELKRRKLEFIGG